MLDHPRFRSGNYDTNFIPQEYHGLADLEQDGADPQTVAISAAAVALMERQHDVASRASRPAAARNPWREQGRREGLRG